MEKHKCKLCFRSFSNGRALGGHMRSHMMNLPIHQKPQPPINQLRDESESASSSSSSSDEDEEDEGEEKGLLLSYGLRENPKKSFRLADPEFSFAVPDNGSVVLQDRESETESSKNPVRRRSKRVRKSGITDDRQYQQQYQETKNKLKSSKLSKTESWVDPEPVSSISDTTTEEDVAFCLMMLSRDKWLRNEEELVGAEKSIDETDDDSGEFIKTPVVGRGKYKCETCKKVFRSYQALGGHRASHKKIKVNNNNSTPPQQQQQQPVFVPENNAFTSSTFDDHHKIHECPVCLRVFASGQALGGHKRSHHYSTNTSTAKSSAKFSDNLIDLNLPAPIDDDEASQIELSAVSDAEFVNPIRR